MYEIRPESIKTFVEDSGIKLPRFQRKQTWDDIKNFKLMISLFKEYPLGVCILNIEKSKGKTIRWLLDGRQRRSALIKFYTDPEAIYVWAKKFLGLKSKDQPYEVKDKFWNKINEYLEEDEAEDQEKTPEETIEDDERQGLSENDEESTYGESMEELTEYSSGLDLLLEIILLIHNKTPRYSGFTRPFDFTKIIHNLPYMEIQNGKPHLNSRKVRSFINEFKTYCNDENKDISKEAFFDYITMRFSLDDEKKKRFKKILDKNWKDILKRIDLIDKIESIYMNSKIGLIEVKNLSPTDAQKIFNIINSEGTKLTAVEILSAKPSWNIKINHPSLELEEKIKELYKTIDIVPQDVVRWDVAATLIERVDPNTRKLFFKIFSDSKSDFEKKITLGFKILSGIFENGVKKEDIDKLSKDENINWEVDIEEVLSDINTFTKIIRESTYFKYLSSWGFSIMDILSDAIAIDFILILYKDWKRKNKPIGSSQQTKEFQKNAFILIDRLIYEYITRQWRGSSDSKIGKSLRDFGSSGHFTANDIFEPLSTEKWITLLSEIFDNNTIQNEKISVPLLRPILYHFYAIKNIQGPDAQYHIEVDHIIPQTLFDSSTLPEKEYLKDNLFNLALLPKNENISKRNKRLIEINDNWLKDQVEKYTFIKKVDFLKYSDLNHWKDLKEYRKEIFMKTFTDDRNGILNN